MINKENNNWFGAGSLRCEGQSDPIGIEAEKPEFSWIYKQPGMDRIQSAYRIIVSSAKDCTEGDMWDSGKVRSGKTCNIPYEGKPLKSKTRYYWKADVWDGDGNNSGYCGDACFETGILDRADWVADWITGFDLLRKEFTADSEVIKARAYIACIGYYELRLNGFKIGDRVLTPSHTEYEKRIEYHAYDITDYIKRGTNAAGIMLGHGMPANVPFNEKNASAILQMEIFFKDGSMLAVNTDKTWEGSTDGPIVENSVYDGEVYDARKEQDGWDKPGFTGKWQPALLKEKPLAKLVPEILPPIKIVKDLAPVAINRISDSVDIVDLGQNIAGWARIQVQGECGTEVVMKYAELLNEDGTVNQLNIAPAKAMDKYSLKGQGLETYEPRFTYHGFRYIQVENYPGRLTADKITGRVVRSSVEETGSFKCSDDMLNKIHSAMKWTLGNNLHSLPTDCPQRAERRGWMADAHIASEACIHNYDMRCFYKKWLDDIRDLQNEQTGAVEYPMAPRWAKNQSILWQSAYFIIAWNLYKYYDDVSVLKDHYENLKAFFIFWSTLTNGNKQEDRNPALDDEMLTGCEVFGDWLAIQRTDHTQIINGFYYMAACIMASISKILGKQEDSTFFSGKADRIKQGYNAAFLAVSDFYRNQRFYVSGLDVCQLTQALPIWLGIVPEENMSMVEDKLLWYVEKVQGSPQVNTGIIGTKYLIEALSKMGRNDLVYKLYKREDYPGWGFMINNGATTIWERWQHMVCNQMNSHDHPALAAPDTWFFKELAGIRADGALVDDRKTFHITPYFAENISSAEVHMDTPWGRVGVSWNRDGDDIDVKVEAPANTMLVISFEIPGCSGFSLYENGIMLDEGQLEITACKVTRRTGSGEYDFKLAQN